MSLDLNTTPGTTQLPSWERPITTAATNYLMENNTELYNIYCRIIDYARGGSPVVMGYNEIQSLKLALQEALGDRYKSIEYGLDRALRKICPEA